MRFGIALGWRTLSMVALFVPGRLAEALHLGATRLS